MAPRPKLREYFYFIGYPTRFGYVQKTKPAIRYTHLFNEKVKKGDCFIQIDPDGEEHILFNWDVNRNEWVDSIDMKAYLQKKEAASIYKARRFKKAYAKRREPSE